MTEEYYSNLELMNDNELETFLKENPTEFKGRGMALTGVIIGSIIFGILLLYLIVRFVF